MITRELPQYADIVRRLTPVLAGLPPKLIAIDGPMSSGKKHPLFSVIAVCL
jgi:hypothetical protein